MKAPNSNVREGYTFSMQVTKKNEKKMHVRQDPVADQINANVYPKSNFFFLGSCICCPRPSKCHDL